MKNPYTSAAVRKILLISLTNLGDVILTTPVMAALRENFSGASLSVLIGPKAEELLRGSRTVNEVILYNKHLGILDKLKLVKALREKKFDLVVDLRDTLIPYLIGAGRLPRLFFKRSPVSMRERHLR